MKTLILLLLFCLGSSLYAAERVALVIGNDKYDQAPLENCVNDARAIKDMLVKKLAFPAEGIVYAENADKDTVFLKIEAFKKVARNAKIAMVYYAGHGMESLDGGSNYLMPVNADMGGVAASDALLQSQGVDIKTAIMDPLAKITTSCAKVVVMDCCRQRPLARGVTNNRAGGDLKLYGDDEIPADTLVLLAAAPGRLANDGINHGPFTAAMLEHLPTPGKSVLDSFFAVSDAVKANTANSRIKQVPWMKFDGSGTVFRNNLFVEKVALNRNAQESTITPEIQGKVFTSPTTRQEFVLIGRNSSNKNVFMCKWETRVMDWKKFSKDPSYQEFLAASGAKLSTNWENPFVDLSPPLDQAADEPVVCINLRQAKAFCAWLSKLDGLKYRVPTDEEWNLAVGLEVSSSTMPFKQDRMENRKYPWGGYFPPRKGDGNYYGAENGNTEFPNDGYRYTAPVGKFSGNSFGIFDLGGNASEVCDTKYNPSSGSGEGTCRGGNWSEEIPDMLTSDHRGNGTYSSVGDDYSNTIGFRIVLIE